MTNLGQECGNNASTLPHYRTQSLYLDDLLFPNLLVHLLQQSAFDRLLKCLFIQKPRRNLFVLLHPIDEEPLQRFRENEAEVIHRVREGGLLQVCVRYRILSISSERPIVSGFRPIPDTVPALLV